MDDITRVVAAVGRGEAGAADQLLPLVYEELRRLAAQKLAREPSGLTLQATALVHEAYLRVAGSADPLWDGRGHFFAAAAEAMRRILVENARRKKAAKHGGGRQRVDSDTVAIATPELDEDLEAIDEALEIFAKRDPIKAELVKLRYFAGLTIEEAADALGISAATAKRYWTYSRAWLYQQVSGGAISEIP
jgi:RNA polymerase sigma factor (TIGR02999 family)